MSLVSVIIPTYKSDRTLECAIDSVLNQNYSYIEVIIVDDNDPNTIYRNNTEDIMLKYKNDNRVMYIKHSHNQNGAAARNTGFKNSSGKYISFLDDDDIFLQNKVALQVENLEKHSNFDAVYCGRYKNDKIISYTKIGNLSKEILLLKYTPCTPSLMVRKECYFELNGFDETYKRHQDFEFLLRFFKKFSIGVVDKPLIRLGTNGVDNMLHGKKLRQLKMKFLRDFDSYIDEIDKDEKSFKQTVYAVHYFELIRDHILHHYYILAIKDFLIGLYKSRLKLYAYLWKYIIKIKGKGVK